MEIHDEVFSTVYDSIHPYSYFLIGYDGMEASYGH